MRSEVDILMVGHFAVDRLVVDGEGVVASGGAVYYGSIALSRLGYRVGVVTRLHPRDHDRLLELQDAGVRVYATEAPDTSGIENVYNSADMERRTCKPLGFAGAFRPREIPPIAADIFAVVPIMAGEVDLPLLRRISGMGPMALDLQGFVRVREGDHLVSKPWPEMAEGLALTTYLKADQAEAELLTGEIDPIKATRALAAYGPREVVLTQSSGVTVLASGEIYTAPFRPRSLVGRTGRGDTCFATYLGSRLSMSPAEACRWAAAVTTLKQENPGPWQGNPEEVRDMLDS